MVFGRSVSDADMMTPNKPATIAETVGAATPLLRLLAGLPGHETDARLLRS